MVRDYALIGAVALAVSLFVFVIGLTLGVLDGVGYRVASILLAVGAGFISGMGFAFGMLRNAVRRLLGP